MSFPLLLAIPAITILVLAPMLLLIGLFSPRLVGFKTRKKALYIYGGLFLISIVLTVILEPYLVSDQPASIPQQREEQVVSVPESNVEETTPIEIEKESLEVQSDEKIESEKISQFREFLTEAEDILSQGKALESVRGETGNVEVCVQRMNERLIPRVEKLNDDFETVFPMPQSISTLDGLFELSAGKNYLRACVTCLDSAIESCNLAEPYLKTAREVADKMATE